MSIVEDHRDALDQLLAPAPEAPAPPAPPRKKRWARLVLLVAAVLVVSLAVGAVALWRSAPAVGHLGDPFSAIPAADRPTVEAAAGTAQNILLIGSDSRANGTGDKGDEDDDDGASTAPEVDWTRGGQRSDVLAVLHLSADGRSAAMISIPRDSWVPVPGYGTTKVNAAFAYGGAELAVRTVEQLTGVRIDHVVAIDFSGFARITDALGGVKICVPKTVTDHLGTVAAGCQVMDGQQALTYVRQRKTLAGGDFDRERRQQNWMRSVLAGATDRGLLSDPAKLADVVGAVAASVRTDDGLGEPQLLAMAVDHRDLRAANVAFLQAPLASPATGREGSQSVVYLDPAAGAELWQAVKADDVATWVAAHPTATLGDTVR
ncbi:transcriptional attenuator, LytR family [Quadrisphaera granulorum]|uniref:LytR family transcriptional attenuator n=1 Tax=Quadrisphaera granulorum TaxID=317664 RepID=A0A316AF89_9ACTN|nr:LCP family protein [Quadrisphaera granulorum]PWJ56029.1 LytR family transcriptional attenuator [Quadrisphaera granulorum]SZE94663.1 transcriptional attenuator, LytR family [Quadrisphaera granulorum]